MNPSKALSGVILATALCAAPGAASAFCGFYVGGGDAQLYNDATVVVMMRDGTRTVLSMQNNYQGPPSDFAMVIPVPVVLQEENVKTLPADVFDRVDKLAAPRLVEYWEQDPCNPYERSYDMAMPTSRAVEMSSADDESDEDEYHVKIEAQFTVGEYEIVILSAQDSTGLDRWLRKENYRIPAGAEPLLRPYVAQGMKFFVAKVDSTKVRFAGGKAILSPLRFHYDATQFNLPIRLGLVNSSGTQDLLVHILAKGQRYEVANYPNVTIPTNLAVKDETRTGFGTFYNALFAATAEKYPGAVVTEYAWDAGSCDPCPTPPLTDEDVMTLGGDVVGDSYGYVLTRLHARYGKDAVGADLVFREAVPIVGGREFVTGEGGALERGAREDSVNNFQGRYVIRHGWTGAVACETPQRGIWGGPPDDRGTIAVKAAEDLAFGPKADPAAAPVALGSYLGQDVEEIDFKLSAAAKGVKFVPGGIQKGSGCAGCSAGGVGGLGVGLGTLGLVGWLGRRRRKSLFKKG